MTLHRFTLGVSLACCLLSVALLVEAAPTRDTHKHARTTGFAHLPLSFEANRGQTDAQVKFLSHGKGYSLFLTPSESVLTFQGVQPRDGKGARGKVQKTTSTLHMKLAGGNRSPEISGLQELPGRSNYLIGRDPAKWRTEVPTYGKVSYGNVYPGVDLVFYGNEQSLEYDFVVAPGRDPKNITLAFDTNESGGVKQHGRGNLLSITRSGDLLVQTASGELRFRKPVVYQRTDSLNHDNESGERISVDGRYVLKGKGGLVGFALAKYDPSKTLVIDPTLAFSTYLGGNGIDGGSGGRIAVDPAGNIYVAAQTNSINFPTTGGTLRAQFGGGVSPCNQPPWFLADLCGDGMVVKLSPNGNLIYSTYIGGSGDDGVVGLAVDASGNAYLAGFTDSPNFPTTAGAYESKFAGEDTSQWYDLQGDGFVAVLNSSGTGFLYSTYLGGKANEYARAIAVDSSGKIYVSGTTDGSDFPTTPGAFLTSSGGGAWMAKIDPAQSGAPSLVYSTYLGPVNALFFEAVDAGGNAYVTGQTSGSGYPATPGALQTTDSIPTGFVTKLNSTGTGLVYSTMLGGSTPGDSGYGIAVDAAGDAYVGGGTGSSDFPVTPGAFQTTYAGNGDCFVTKLNPSGTGMIYSTYLGGSGSEACGVTIDSSGNAFVAGGTTSIDFPAVNAVQSAYAAGTGTYPITGVGQFGDGIVAELNPSGSALLFSTYLGGTNNDGVYGLATDSSDNIYLMGYTTSTDFPTTPGAIQPNNAGSYDLFVAKITPTNNTATGGNVVVQPTSNVRLTFSGITNSGTTAVTQTSVAPPVPTGFTVGNPTTYYELSTTATYAGAITVCLNFAGVTFPSGSPELFHYENGNWVNVTTSVDSVNQIICGSVTSLSPFGVLGAPVTVTGFEQPLTTLVPAGTSVPLPSHAFKQGTTLPLKVQIYAGSTLLTNATAAPPRITGITRNGSALNLDTLDLDTGQSDSGDVFRFSGSEWDFNLSTKGLSAGTYTITIQVPGGTLYDAGFVLK